MSDDVSIHQAKTHLSRLIRLVESGEEVVIRRGRRPVAVLVGYQASPVSRQPGRLHGQIELADDFDTLPDEVARAFEADS